MKKLFLFLFSFGLLISTSVTAEIVLYCNGELATGLVKESEIWRAADFQPDRYTIKFSDDYSEVKGLFAGHAWQCKNAYKTEATNTVICSEKFLGNGASFTYHKNTKRFVHVFGTASGFVINNNDTTNINAGTCQKF